MSQIDVSPNNDIWKGIMRSSVAYCRGNPRTTIYKITSIWINPQAGIYTVNCTDSSGRVRTFQHPENSGDFYRLDHIRKAGDPEFGEDSGNLSIGTTIERVTADGRKACGAQALRSIDVTLRAGRFVAQCVGARSSYVSRPFHVVSMLYLRINDPRHSTISTVHADPRRPAFATDICRQSDKRWTAMGTIPHGDHYEITCAIVTRPKIGSAFAYFLTRDVRYVQ